MYSNQTIRYANPVIYGRITSMNDEIVTGNNYSLCKSLTSNNWSIRKEQAEFSNIWRQNKKTPSQVVYFQQLQHGRIRLRAYMEHKRRGIFLIL